MKECGLSGAAARTDEISSFDIYDGDELIGFALLRRFDPDEYFLWDYAIDERYQNRRYGQIALRELIEWMKTN